MELARIPHLDTVPMPKPPTPVEQAMAIQRAAIEALADDDKRQTSVFRTYRDAQQMMDRLGATWEMRLPPKQAAAYQVWLREQAGENVRDELPLPEFMDEPL